MLSECLILPSGFTAGKLRLCNYKILLKLNSEVFLCSELAQGFSAASVKLNFATLKMRCGSQGVGALARRRMRRRERNGARAEKWKGATERSVLIFPLSVAEWEKMGLSVLAVFKPIPSGGH